MNGNALSMAKTITAAGGIGLALVLAYFYWNTVGNHMDHSTAAIFEGATALTEVSTVLQHQTSVLERLDTSLEANTQSIERLNFILNE